MAQLPVSVQDLESQNLMEKPRNEGHLKNRINNYDRAMKHLKDRRGLEWSEELFWYHEFGTHLSTDNFERSEKDRFGDSLENLRRVLDHSTRSAPAPLQLW